MKTIKSILFSGLMAFALVLSSCAQKGGDSYTNVNVAELKEKTSDKDVVVVDIRTPQETEEGYIEGAKLIDFYGDNFMTEMEKFDKETNLYIICRSGGRSANASAQLVEKGFKHIHNVEGGFMAWEASKYPFVK